MVNGIAQNFIGRSFETKTEEFTNASNWLDVTTRELKAKVEKAEQELADYTRVGQHRAVVDIGSRHQPFKLFLPDIESGDGQRLLALLDSRYIAKDPTYVRRSYAYVRGRLKLFREEPEITVTTPEQILDTPSG